MSYPKNFERDGAQTTAHTADQATELREAGWTEAQETPVSRKPRRRGKGWLEKAIASGEVRDPNTPPPETKETNGFVVNVPLAESGVTGTEK